jgi:hypothetical protein
MKTTIPILLALLATACGSSHPAQPHEPFPQIPDNGGPILANPEIVTVTFPGYAFESDVQAFGAWVPGSAWLPAVGAEYGIGAATASAVVLTSDAAPASASDATTRALLDARVADGTLPTPGANTLFVLYYPPSTTVTGFDGGPICNGVLGGYHWEGSIGGRNTPYAVVPVCSTGAQAVFYAEAAAGHEIVEAVTDPFPLSAPAWAITDESSPWAMLAGEVADLCEVIKFDHEGAFYASRSWSNAAAAAGTNPCAPDPGGVFYDTSATPSTVQHVAPGASVTFTLRGWSFGPISPWTLQPSPVGDFTPQIALDSSTMAGGGETAMTVTVPAGTPPGRALILLFSVRNQASLDYQVWPIGIATP